MLTPPQSLNKLDSRLPARHAEIAYDGDKVMPDTRPYCVSGFAATRYGGPETCAFEPPAQDMEQVWLIVDDQNVR